MTEDDDRVSFERSPTFKWHAIFMIKWSRKLISLYHFKETVTEALNEFELNHSNSETSINRYPLNGHSNQRIDQSSFH